MSDNNTARHYDPSLEREEVTERTIVRRSTNYDIKKLWFNQKEILRLLASGIYTPKEVAEMCDVAVSTVNRLARTEHGKEYMEMISGAADNDTRFLVSRINKAAHIAFSVQLDMMMDENEKSSIRNNIADKIMDRAGYTPISKSMNMNVNQFLENDDISDIKQRAMELKKENEVKQNAE